MSLEIHFISSQMSISPSLDIVNGKVVFNSWLSPHNIVGTILTSKDSSEKFQWISQTRQLSSEISKKNVFLTKQLSTSSSSTSVVENVNQNNPSTIIPTNENNPLPSSTSLTDIPMLVSNKIHEVFPMIHAEYPVEYFAKLFSDLGYESTSIYLFFFHRSDLSPKI